MRSQKINDIKKVLEEAISKEGDGEITVEKLDIVPTYNTNLVTINLTYRVNISNEKDTITINLE